MTTTELAQKENKLIESLARIESLIVAYSGGVDSSLLAYYAHKILGTRAKIVIAVSASLAHEELVAARSQALQFNWNLVEIATTEVEKPEYQRNDGLRCYFCKSTLFEALDEMALREGFKFVAYGANVDDASDFRPGHKAAAEHQVLSPLQAAGLIKDEIRTLAKNAGLPSWDRPQAACLSSRFPTFVPVTIEKLAIVDQSETYLHSLGFRQVRVRHHDDIARIELEGEDLVRLGSNSTLMQEISTELKKLGYRYVVLDLDGYRQGSANRLLAASGRQDG